MSKRAKENKTIDRRHSNVGMSIGDGLLFIHSIPGKGNHVARFIELGGQFVCGKCNKFIKEK